MNEDTWDETGVNIESRDAGVVKQLAVADAEATEGEDPSLDFGGDVRGRRRHGR